MSWDKLADTVATTTTRVFAARSAAGELVTYRPFAGGSIDIEAEFLAAHTATDPEIGTVVDDVGARLWVRLADLPAMPVGGDPFKADEVDVPDIPSLPGGSTFKVSRVHPDGDGVVMLELNEEDG